MDENSVGPRIRDPEEELEAVYRARVRPFADLGQSEKAAQYERAWQIARSALRKVRERGADHAP